MPLPDKVHDLVREALDAKRRSCLTCVNYHTLGRGHWLACRIRPRVKEPAARFDAARAEMAVRRAKKCKFYEGEDDD